MVSTKSKTEGEEQDNITNNKKQANEFHGKSWKSQMNFFKLILKRIDVFWFAITTACGV